MHYKHNKTVKKWKNGYIIFCEKMLVLMGWKPRRAKLDAISMWESDIIEMYNNDWVEIMEVVSTYTPVEYAKIEVFARWGA